MANPTMEKSPKAESKEAGKYQELIQQFKNLEREWESLEKSRPRNARTYSTFSSDSSSILTSFDHLLENSPRLLMSSLQHSNIVKKCDIAVEEILRERRAAIISGKIKGRRLFGAADEESDLDYGAAAGGGEICSDNWVNDVIQEREVIVDDYCVAETSSGGDNESFSFSDSSPSEEKVVVEEKTEVEVEMVEKRGGGGRWWLPVAWFAFLLILLVTGVVCISCNGRSVHETEFLLVPT